MIGLLLMIIFITLSVVIVTEYSWLQAERNSIRWRVSVDLGTDHDESSHSFVYQLASAYYQSGYEVIAVTAVNRGRWHLFCNNQHHIIHQDIWTWWMSDAHFLTTLAASCGTDVLICPRHLMNTRNLQPNVMLTV